MPIVQRYRNVNRIQYGNALEQPELDPALEEEAKAMIFGEDREKSLCLAHEDEASYIEEDESSCQDIEIAKSSKKIAYL